MCTPRSLSRNQPPAGVEQSAVAELIADIPLGAAEDRHPACLGTEPFAAVVADRRRACPLGRKCKRPRRAFAMTGFEACLPSQRGRFVASPYQIGSICALYKLNSLPMSESKPAADSQADFDQLQKKLVPLWKSIERFNQDPQTIVVVPSMSIDAINSGAVIHAYEERFLFLLLLLRQPRARLIYVTSRTILPSIIDYYLDLLPGVIPSHARQRLFLPSPMDGSVRSLSEKLLERPRLIERIRSLIMDPDRAHLVPFNTTHREKELALQLGIPMYGADPKFFPLGTKSGCRKIFMDENVPYPLGREDIGSKEDLVEAIAQMRRTKASIKQVMVKLNEGVSGEGNAVIDLVGRPAPGDSKEVAMLEDRLRAMQFESRGVTFESYMDKLEQRKGVVEERIIGEQFRSPSVQLRVTPLGKVELLSTHDQLLGGPSGQ